MKITWENSRKATLEVDETEYMMLSFALSVCLEYPLPFERIQKEIFDGLDLRNIVKQKERINDK